MIATRQIDQLDHVTTLVFDGRCDYPDMRASVLTLSDDATLPPRRPLLFDLRAASWRPTMTEALELADVIAQPSRLLRHRLAFLVTDATLLPYVQRIVALVKLRGGEARCVVDLPSARTWFAAR